MRYKVKYIKDQKYLCDLNTDTPLIEIERACTWVNDGDIVKSDDISIFERYLHHVTAWHTQPMFKTYIRDTIQVEEALKNPRSIDMYLANVNDF